MQKPGTSSRRASSCSVDTRRLLISAKKTLKLEPTQYRVLNGLGLIQHFEKKEYREAAGCLRKSLDIDPWSPVTSKLSICVDLLNSMVLDDELSR